MTANQKRASNKPSRVQPARLAKAKPAVTEKRRPTFRLESVATLREGIPGSDWKKTSAALGIPSERLIAWLDVKRSTIKRDEQSGARLNAANSDKLYRVQQIFEKAMRVFEEDASARAWLQKPQRTLGGEVPLSLLDTTLGYELVGDALERIEAGIAA